MGMTLTEGILEVRNNIKRTVTGITDARIMRWFNWAQIYLTDLHVYQESKIRVDADSVTPAGMSTAAGTSDYAWITNMKDLYSITVQNSSLSEKLTYVPARSFDEIVPRPALISQDCPVWYVDFGSYFELFPIPDAIYELVQRISIYPTEFTDATTDGASEFDLKHKDALICAVATVFGFQALREIEDATYWAQAIVPGLFDASLNGERSIADWNPIARGFGGNKSTQVIGEYWLSPFTKRG